MTDSDLIARLRGHIERDCGDWIESLSLKKGNHRDQKSHCVMEAVAYVAGEPWSDAPKCACPVITALLVNWNDSLPTDADRDRLLKPLIPLVVDTRTTDADEQRRGWMCVDWLWREQVAAWMELAGLADQAASLRALPELDSDARLKETATIRAAAGDAAGDAAWAAARDAADKKLAPTVARLQESAQGLVRRMCAVGRPGKKSDAP